ncbi:MAG: alpha/beta hydrolase [Candidatus Omnitrophota bacterium]
MSIRLLFQSFFAGLALIVLAGCATLPSHEERIATADSIAQAAGLRRTIFRTPTFALTGYQRLTESGGPVQVYIEGDGYAWVTSHRLSSDPTPRDPIALRLAAEDPAPNVIYLGRPCQYTDPEMDPLCEDDRFWSEARFSEEVIAALDQALDQIQERIKTRDIRLIGYSGGGAVAVLVAQRRHDIQSLRTVAGNLDPGRLNRLHGASPLSGSLDPLKEAALLRMLPQRHFAGDEDSVVPVTIAEGFIQKMGASSCVAMTVVQGMGHQEGWKGKWRELLDLPVECSPSLANEE